MFKRFIMPTFLFNIEKWKWNSEYRVYVSNLGHFKDEYKNPIAVKINTNGYILISTYCGMRLAHRLVMMTWAPTADMENLTVDHLDHNKRNNELSNLEWVTFEENQRRAKEDMFRKEREEKPVAKITVETPLPLTEDIKIIITKEIDHVQADKNINNNANLKRKITDGYVVYNNATVAAEATKKRIASMSGVKTKKIARRIVAAAEYNKEYCERRWHYVEEV